MPHKIGILPGDGIGPEVIAEARKALDAAGVAMDAVEYDLGGVRYLRTGEVLPDSVVDELAELDAILLDPVYSGKGMAGLIDLVRKGHFRKGETVVFLHTGGQIGLTAYPREFLTNG